jgi:Holliday junction resolvase RusA-like endonuclease
VTIVLRCDKAPPSVNRAWRMDRKNGRMHRSSEFVTWEKKAVEQFKRTNAQLPSLCYWSAKIFVPVIQYRPDIDNMCKGTIDAIVRAKLAPDDFYAVKLQLEYWAGDIMIIHLTEEPLEKWQAILKTTKDTIRKMNKAKLARSSLRLV